MVQRKSFPMNKSPQLVDSGFEIETVGLVHRVWKPEGAGLFPVVVMLHGHLGNEDVMWVFAQTIPPSCVIVSPRATMQLADKSYSWLPRVGNEWPALAQFDEAATAVGTFIRALPALYPVDLNRVYLMGFSQGAALSFAVAMQSSGWVKGIASLVGFMPLHTEEAEERAALRNIPVLMAAGLHDERIPLAISQKSAETVQALGAFLEYREYETGHKLDAAGMRKLKTWWSERLAGN